MEDIKKRLLSRAASQSVKADKVSAKIQEMDFQNELEEVIYLSVEGIVHSAKDRVLTDAANIIPDGPLYSRQEVIELIESFCNPNESGGYQSGQMAEHWLNQRERES